jgi:hypothetical protein
VKWSVGIVVVVVLLALTGCGSGGGSSTAAGLSESEWISRADDICARTEELGGPPDEEIQAVERAPRSESQLESLGAILMKTVKELRPIYAELGELPAPEGDKEPLKTLSSFSPASLAFAKEGARALEGRDFARYKALQGKQHAISRRWEAFAKSYGFRVCGLEKG